MFAALQAADAAAPLPDRNKLADLEAELDQRRAKLGLQYASVEQVCTQRVEQSTARLLSHSHNSKRRRCADFCSVCSWSEVDNRQR